MKSYSINIDGEMINSNKQVAGWLINGNTSYSTLCEQNLLTTCMMDECLHMLVKERMLAWQIGTWRGTFILLTMNVQCGSSLKATPNNETCDFVLRGNTMRSYD